jgi:hypothetical protein
MPTATATAAWTVGKRGKQIQVCYGDLCTEMSFEQANSLAEQIQRMTGYRPAASAASASKTATPRTVNKKGTKKGGKC